MLDIVQRLNANRQKGKMAQPFLNREPKDWLCFENDMGMK
jgi:hypothetical protein